MGKKNKPLQVIRERAADTTINVDKVVDSKGVEHEVKTETFSEREVEDRRLVKIAPMFFFSLDSHKILMIPFSIQFTPEKYAEQVGKMAVNFQTLLKRIEKGEFNFNKPDTESK